MFIDSYTLATFTPPAMRAVQVRQMRVKRTRRVLPDAHKIKFHLEMWGHKGPALDEVIELCRLDAHVKRQRTLQARQEKERMHGFLLSDIGAAAKAQIEALEKELAALKAQLVSKSAPEKASEQPESKQEPDSQEATSNV